MNMYQIVLAFTVTVLLITIHVLNSDFNRLRQRFIELQHEYDVLVIKHQGQTEHYTSIIEDLEQQIAELQFPKDQEPEFPIKPIPQQEVSPSWREEAVLAQERAREEEAVKAGLHYQRLTIDEYRQLKEEEMKNSKSLICTTDIGEGSTMYGSKLHPGV